MICKFEASQSTCYSPSHPGLRSKTLLKKWRGEDAKEKGEEKEKRSSTNCELLAHVNRLKGLILDFKTCEVYRTRRWLRSLGLLRNTGESNSAAISKGAVTNLADAGNGFVG